MMIPKADLLPGDEVISAEEILSLDDPIFDPSTRPSVETALALSSGMVAGLHVPFASGTFEHHEDVAEQKLFHCLFGRDSLVISSLLRQQNDDLQGNTVCALAAFQGQEFNSLSEEEPGRIAHEVRDLDDPQAERIAAESGWQFPYYGSVDATLLWLIAVDEISRNDSSILDRQIGSQSLAQRAELAASWILNRLENDGGYIRSKRANPKGILNQVWKDSGDSYLTLDGRVASSSGTVSAETIAQTYDALLAASRLAKMSSHSWKVTPNEFISTAHRVRDNLLNSWWLGDRFAMGLGLIDETEVMLDAIASNQWRLLDSEILAVPEAKAFVTQLADSVTDAEILGANGIRTLGKSNPRYRPGGYHTGSSWPMDTALIVRGLLKHGAKTEAAEVAGKSIRAIESVGAYPELFRSDESEKLGVSRFVIDVRDAQLGTSNRICQPPQLLQGWTIAAYSWFKRQQFGGN
jgi:glycogen debranching enzyme